MYNVLLKGPGCKKKVYMLTSNWKFFWRHQYLPILPLLHGPLLQKTVPVIPTLGLNSPISITGSRTALLIVN